MITKMYCISLFTLIFYLNTYSQTMPAKYNIVELSDGKIIQKELYFMGIESYSGSKKIKLCQENTKDCNKIPIAEINKISIIDDQGDILRSYKVLYGPKESIPRMCLLIYEGVNFEVYYFNTTHGSNKFAHSQRFITKINSNIIEYNYAQTSDKKNLEKLTEFFKDCSELIKEATQKKAHKKNDITYYYKLADKCDF